LATASTSLAALLVAALIADFSSLSSAAASCFFSALLICFLIYFMSSLWPSSSFFLSNLALTLAIPASVFLCASLASALS